MRINKVLCDICNLDAGYNGDWKIPKHDDVKEHREIYEYLARYGYKDFCKDCFIEVRQEMFDYMAVMVEELIKEKREEIGHE